MFYGDSKHRDTRERKSTAKKQKQTPSAVKFMDALIKASETTPQVQQDL